MRIAVVQFPGSNCERETMLALERAGMQPQEFLWNAPMASLDAFQGFVIVGGFSYEDRARAGVIAAQDPLMQGITQQSLLGKPVLGICNGAQILVESGLVPGLARQQLGMALTNNKRMQHGKVLGHGYYNAWVNLRLAKGYQWNAFTRHLSADTIVTVPVAHAEGRFVVPPVLLDEIARNGQIIFQYCDADGAVVDAFPVNPNGSVRNIAAVSNKAGNVLAIMPHPERTKNGDLLFTSMRDYIQSGYVAASSTLHYQPRMHSLKKYRPTTAAHVLVVSLVIADNQAISVENALKAKGLPVRIKRAERWEVQCDSVAVLEKIKASGVLFNANKETLIADTVEHPALTATFLVRAHDDLVGQQKCQMLQQHFAIDGVQSIAHSVLWQVVMPEGDVRDHIIDSHILFNPHAEECYDYVNR